MTMKRATRLRGIATASVAAAAGLLLSACGSGSSSSPSASPPPPAPPPAPLPTDWDADRRLTRTGAASQTSINFARSIAADDAGRVHLVWRGEQDGNPEIYYKRSPDGGVSWSPPIRLSDADGKSDNPSIAVDGESVHIFWWDERTAAPQIWHRHSDDGGLTWRPEAQITKSPGGGAYCSAAASGANVHVVYVDGRDGNSEVYYTHSLDAGATWSVPVRLSSIPHNSYTPTVAVWQSNV